MLQMTPKEKAKELVDKYFGVVTEYKRGLEAQKQCALIAVDEILKTNININYIKVDGDMLSLVEYYSEVKQEIEKL